MRHGKTEVFISCLLLAVLQLFMFYTAANAQSAKAKATPPIKIGYLAPLSGVYAAVGTDMKDGFVLYVSQKGNQMAGRQVEVLVEDDEAKPDVALTKAKKLVERDKVHIITGTMHSGAAQAVADYIKTKKVIFICNAGSDALTQQQFSPYIFRVSFNNSQIAHPLGEWAYKKGHRKAALVAADYTAGYEWVGGFARTFTQSGGSVIQEQYLPLGAPDPAPFITAIKPDVDVVYAFFAGADAMRFVPAYDQYGLKKRATLMGGAITDDSILQKHGDSAIGVVSSYEYVNTLDNAANKAFVSAFIKKFNRPASAYADMGYAGAMVLEKALQTTKGTIEDTQSLISAFENAAIESTPRGPIRLDKYHNIVHNVYIIEVNKVGSLLVNRVIDTYPDVSQFWKWSPDEYLKMPSYTSMKGKWAKQ